MAIRPLKIKITLHVFTYTKWLNIFSITSLFFLLLLWGKWRFRDDRQASKTEPLPAAHFDSNLLLTTVHSDSNALKCWDRLSFIMKLRFCAVLWKRGLSPCREGGVSWRRGDIPKDGWELGNSRLRLSRSFSPWCPIAWGDPWES